MIDWKDDPTNYHKYKRPKVVMTLPEPKIGVLEPDDVLDINRAGNRRNGYHYGIATFSGGTFRFLWLTDEQRREMIEALGGTA